jgi:hypothetical protein
MGTQTIYWAAFNQDSTPELKPQSLSRHIAISQNLHIGHNHSACPAIRDKHSNTFYGVFPYDLNVLIDNGKVISNRGDEVEERQGLYQDSFAFDWHYRRIFFSPEPQLMETSPAYLHQTPHTQYGHSPSGSFDIGRWFRPSAPAFQLWSGIKEFKALKDEPHIYFNFPSENRIQLQEFKMNNYLYTIAGASVFNKFNVPKQPLSAMYKHFVQSGLHKKVMKEIEANLL